MQGFLKQWFFQKSRARSYAGAWIACAWIASLAGCTNPPSSDLDLSQYTVVDLTHVLDENTIYWPTSPSAFELQSLSFGETTGGWFYAANAFCTPEHGGTHLDAPIHFYRDRWTAEEIPVDRFVAPAIVIDIRHRTQADPDYRLAVEDVTAFEQQHGTIASGSVVLVQTGWSQYWPDRKRYLGDDTPGDASNLHFPSFGADATRLLVERGVFGLGVDTASIDHGASRDFVVHRIAAEHNIYGLENLTHLEDLPPTGAVLLALPMKIRGGSGGPARVVALVPRASP